VVLSRSRRGHDRGTRHSRLLPTYLSAAIGRRTPPASHATSLGRPPRISFDGKRLVAR
jgi:hypothetical protein